MCGDMMMHDAVLGTISVSNSPCIDAGAGATLSWTFDYASPSDERPTTMSYAAKYIGGSCDDASQDFDNACTDADAR